MATVCARCARTNGILNQFVFIPRIARERHLPDPQKKISLCADCAHWYMQYMNVDFHTCNACLCFFDSNDEDSCRCSACNICMQCRPDHFCDRMFFRKPVLIVPSFQHPNRLVGVEIEVIELSESSDSRHRGRRKIAETLSKTIAIQHDGSVCGAFDDGFEIITPPLRVYSTDFPECIQNITSALRKYGCSVNDSCGLHVHFDAQDIQHDPTLLSHLLRTIYAVEDILFSMNPPSRWDNRYCLPLSKNYLFEDFNTPMPIEQFEQYWYTIEQYRYCVLEKSEIQKFKSSKYGHAKYSGVNFHSLLHRGTIEFRHHAGTLQEEKILHWVTFLHHLIEYACYEYVDSDVVSLYMLPTSVKKLNQMIDVLHIPQETAEYMKERVKKFNTGFKAFQKNQQKESAATKKRIFENSPKERARRHPNPSDPWNLSTSVPITIRELQRNRRTRTAVSGGSLVFGDLPPTDNMGNIVSPYYAVSSQSTVNETEHAATHAELIHRFMEIEDRRNPRS